MLFLDEVAVNASNRCQNHFRNIAVYAYFINIFSRINHFCFLPVHHAWFSIVLCDGSFIWGSTPKAASGKIIPRQ